ncbi:MAG: peptide ABC transporter substrate-binding protein [Pseudomonadales bacterium]|nr:peptide ABC transporter substrate-binding protein [Pseudomonadales bacterium]
MIRFNQLLVLVLFLSLPSLCLAQAVNARTQSISIALGAEPPDLNSMTSTDQSSIFILNHVMQGLLRYGKNGQLVGGVAEKWTLSNDEAVFWLRKNALWSDGRPVTAHDFVYAWRTVVHPKTASQYAFILYPLKNAEAINQQGMPVEALGVVTEGDFILRIKLQRPCAYFLSLMAFVTYYPIREDFHQERSTRYAAEAEEMLFNGPFKLVKWVHGAELALVKNEFYWDRDNIRLQRIDVPFITTDTGTTFNLFKDGEIAIAGLDVATISNALENRLPIKKFNDGAVFYLEFNHRVGRLTRNKNLRKAIQSVFNANELVNKVIGVPGNRPGESLFPVWLPGKEKTFRQEYPARRINFDVERAKGYLEMAKKELQLESIPPLYLLSGDSPGATVQAEYMQEVLSRYLGLELKLDKQIFKQRLAKMTSGDFDMVAAGWGPDYNDPMTFADLFASWNENNRGRYADKDYDRWVRVAQETSDVEVRMNAFGELQNRLIEDAVLIPQYERGFVYVQNPRLKGVVRRIFGGDPSYYYSYVE